MVFEFSLILIFLAVLLVVCLIAFFIWGLHYAIAMALNGVIGFFALYAVQQFVWKDLLINWLSISLVAIFGIFGFALVLLLHLLGLWF